MVVYWRMGTDPSKYMKNWESFAEQLSYGEKLLIIDNSIVKRESNIVIFSAKSTSTLNQNIATWETFGLCKKTGSNTIVVLDVENLNFEEIVEKVKWNLLVESKKIENQRLKNSIMLRVLYLVDSLPKDTKIDLVMHKNSEGFNFAKLKKDIGALDKKLASDPIFVKALKDKWNKEK